MSFRTRLALAAAAAVAVAVALASATTYFVARSQLRGEVDDALLEEAETIAAASRRPPRGEEFGSARGPRFFERLPPPTFGTPTAYVQLVTEDLELVRDADAEVELPVDERVVEVASGTRGPFFATTQVSDVRTRVLTVPLGDGLALQVARSLEEVEAVMGQLGLALGAISLGGVVLAAVLGLVVTRAAVGPIRRLSKATTRVGETRDLSERIAVSGKDELSRLAENFNSMLAALEDSQRAQRQLVADASHELRTPLTSLRTNLEVLAFAGDLGAEDRKQLLGDVVAQLEELSELVGELVDLAREGGDEFDTEEFRLDELVEDAVERAQRHVPGVEFVCELEPALVVGVPNRVDRAVANLLDNAMKWSQAGGTVNVALHDGELTVRDHGPGFAESDLPYVFDRFYRAAEARGMPGSGLGLAIVREVAESHGGSVVAENAEGGGACLRLRLPTVAELLPGSLHSHLDSTDAGEEAAISPQ